MTAMLIVFFTSAFFHEYLISGELSQRLKRERAGLVGYICAYDSGWLSSYETGIDFSIRALQVDPFCHPRWENMDYFGKTWRTRIIWRM